MRADGVHTATTVAMIARTTMPGLTYAGTRSYPALHRGLSGNRVSSEEVEGSWRWPFYCSHTYSMSHTKRW